MATIYFDTRSKNARAILEQELDIVDDLEEADLVWLRGHHSAVQDRLQRDQLINYIPGEVSLVDKGYLAQYLKLFDQDQTDFDFNLADFFPETYCLYDRDERQAFFDQLPAQESEENLWILKPADSSKGRGVGVTWQFDGLRQLYERVQADGAEEEISPYVAQRYIKNPLLLDQRKSEIRLYLLIACVDPLLVLLFGEGTVRLNNKPFSLGDFDNELVHVTNAFQQKRHPDFDPDLDLKWSFDKLQRYIVEALRLAEGEVIEERIKPQAKEMLSFVLESTRHVLEPQPSGVLSFGLYGVDVILDDNLRPWLTEVQLGPGLSHRDEVKMELLPGMVLEAVKIILEVQERVRQKRTLAELDNVRRFEWMVNEA